MADLNDWSNLVNKESKGLTPDEMSWLTPEGILLKQLYTAEDVQDVAFKDSLPGFALTFAASKPPCIPDVLDDPSICRV